MNKVFEKCIKFVTLQIKKKRKRFIHSGGIWSPIIWEMENSNMCKIALFLWKLLCD